MRIHLCCGARIEPGWCNIDMDPPADIRHDVRLGLPFADESATMIYSEHALEHFTANEGLALLRECRRVLKPGGALRLSTPHLRYLVALYIDANRALVRAGDEAARGNMLEAHGHTSEAKNLLHAYAAVGYTATSPAKLLNEGMRNWGHLFLYDDLELELVLKAAGFRHIKRQPYQFTDVPGMVVEGRPDCHELIMEAVR